MARSMWRSPGSSLRAVQRRTISRSCSSHRAMYFFLHGHDGFVFFRIFAFQMGDDEEFVVQFVVFDVGEDAVQQLLQALFVGFFEAV